MNHQSNSPFSISIPRADFKGDWHDFARDNAAFIPDDELTRLEAELRKTGYAKHRAHTAGDFDITVVS